MKIAICDDNLQEGKQLQNIVENYLLDKFVKHSVKFYMSSSELMNSSIEYDVFILDIVMNNVLGLDVAKKIHYTYANAQIIFYSSNLDYAPDAFEAFGSGFIAKPLNKKKVYHCLDRVLKKIDNKIIQFKDNESGHEVIVYLNDITLILSKGKYTIVYIKARKIKCRRSMKEWQSLLEAEHFSLCKRGLLVNIHAIDKIDAFNCLFLNNGERISLSRKVGERVEGELGRYWQVNL